MKTQTRIELIKAYLALAELHHRAALECGPYTARRELHRQQAEAVGTLGIAWAQPAPPVQAVPGHTAGQGVCHA